MNILIPTIGLDNRGGTRVTIELANRLARRGHTVAFAMPRGSNLTTFSVDPLVRVREFGMPIPQIEDAASILRMAQLFFLRGQYDVVLANYYLTAFPSHFLQRTGVARHAVYLIQHYEPLAFGEAERTFPRLKKRLAEQTYRYPMAQVTVANWIAKRVHQVGGRPVRVMYPNIDLSTFCPPEDPGLRQENVILAFPGKDVWKGWDDFTTAMEKVARASPGVQVHASSRAVFPMPAGPYTAFHPAGDDELVHLYQTAGLYVHAAWWEGCPLAPLEAMACGAPVVAASSEGIMEYARDGENCLLVPPRSPEALAEAICRVLADAPLRARLTAAGYETVNRFGWPRMADEFEQFLLDLAGRNGRA